MVCEYCEKELKNKLRKFCNSKCYHDSTKGKYKKKYCVTCGKEYNNSITRGKNCSPECFIIYASKIKVGKQNPRFNNGWRQYISKLDHIKECQICGTNKKLETHHLDGNKRNNVIENLIKVCRKCHMNLDGRINNLTHNHGKLY